MKAARFVLRHALVCSLFGGLASPAFAHEPVLRCVLLDESTVRCRGGYAEGEDAPGVNLEVVDYAGETLLASKLGKDSMLTFPRPKTGYYVLLDVGPGSQAIVEHDEIGPPRSRDMARWMRN
ncbi:hypothetical protein B2G71_04300 [Novosphingobium sp. PC22D]|uniref:hypothetical protein n=1 Tax=Novosphingobium sp. PC22D TaxID=1962403 RepID=UPI000BF1CF36|nr:hypothetical protein [Novosphingobium sp. PC22D]PEQ13565.1 hypothetical protein B2G71_04300 [Novosphingobium sp. PC22D]